MSRLCAEKAVIVLTVLSIFDLSTKLNAYAYVLVSCCENRSGRERASSLLKRALIYHCGVTVRAGNTHSW